MKIAQISPLVESVPPKLYGGTERIVSYLTEELVRQGHDVTLFAAGDSVTRARLVAGAPKALRLADVHNFEPFNILQIEAVRRAADEFDILHFHTDFLHFPLFRSLGKATVTTLHGRLDRPGYAELFATYTDMPLVSISDSQRGRIRAQWAATVLHGLPRDLHAFSPRSDGYLAFLGRMSPEKRPDRAIEIARRAGIPLKMAAKVDRNDVDYFESKIRPLLDGPGVEFVGEINESEKSEFLGGALALLFPIDWPEPFGLVMTEAMACGTPVIAWENGSVPEVIEHGRSGMIVRSIDEAVAAARGAASLDRAGVRRAFEQRFTAERMAHDYVRVYQALSKWHEVPAGIAPRAPAARKRAPAPGLVARRNGAGAESGRH